MATSDTCCTIVPYFRVHPGKMEQVQALCEKCVAQTSEEAGALYYGFSFDGDQVHCREGYVDAAAALHHIDRIGPLLQQILTVADLTRLEVHGPEQQLAQLRGPLAPMKPQFFALEYGFRR